MHNSIIAELNRKKRIAIVLLLLGLGTFYGSAAYHEHFMHWPYLIVPIVAFILVIIGTGWFSLGLRCPQCRRSLCKEAQKGSLLSFPKQMKSCPFCGTSFDSR